MKLEWTAKARASFQAITDPDVRAEVKRVVRRIEAGDPAFPFDVSLGTPAYIGRHKIGKATYAIRVQATFTPGSDHAVLTRVAADRVN